MHKRLKYSIKQYNLEFGLSTHMKKVLQINSCVNMYSTGRIVEEIGNTILEQGWESYVAYGRAARTSRSKLIKIGTDFDIKMHGVQTRLFDRQGLGSKKATEKFIKEVEAIAPDIIHIHNIHDYYINYQLLFNYLHIANIPVVWTFHDFWPITGHCAHFSRIDCQKWKTECHHCPQTRLYPASYFLDRSRSNFRLKKKLFNSLGKMVIVPVSAWVGETLKYSFLSESETQVINNGVDINVFKPLINTQPVREKYNIGNRLMLLGVATAWSASKGMQDYYLLNDLLCNDEVIVMVGLTKEQLKLLPENIIGIQRTEDLNELVALYSAADVVLNLSYQETFGLTTVEGMACGTPGIVYNCTASPELITAETGFVVNPGDINGVLNAVHILKKNGKLYYNEACRERAVKFFSKDERYRDYIELYKKLLDNSVK